MYTLRHDGQVLHPLGGASYVFENDLINWILKQSNKNNLRISVGSQPNSSPHIGTMVVFSLAFALAEKIKQNKYYNAGVVFEVIDTAPSEIKTINNVHYQLSLRSTGIYNKYLTNYTKMLDTLSSLSRVSYSLRKQLEFNKQPVVADILKQIASKRDVLGKILDPDYGKLRIRVACQNCGLTDKHAINTVINPSGIRSFCPEHGWYETTFDKSYLFEYNTPLRNLVRALVYLKDNINPKLNYEWIRVTGSDYAGFYQEQMLYKPVSILGYKTHNLPTILYAPLITDWSGAKISKSLYLKKGAYNYLPDYIVSFEHFDAKYGKAGVKRLYNEVKSWLAEPYKLFRNYSVYYLINLFEHE